MVSAQTSFVGFNWAGMTSFDMSSFESRTGWELEPITFLADQIYMPAHSYDVNYSFCGGFALSPNGWAGMFTFDISSALGRIDWGIEVYF